jgi:hypothetical protein
VTAENAEKVDFPVTVEVSDEGVELIQINEGWR